MLRFFNGKKNDMWLFVGLGNPGGEYAGHRHNIGFMAADAIADGVESFRSFRSKFKGQYTEASMENRKVGILKPQIFMNNSGESVAQAAKFYKIDPDRIVVFYDDLDLKPAQVRVKKGGGAAGHNGIRSVQDHLGTPEFWRVRLGIGRPADKSQVTNYVLGNFAKTDNQWLGRLLDSLARNISIILTKGPALYEKAVENDMKDNLPANRRGEEDGI
jgi:peptidyl-tRNA hydrolase, PTH1 family